MSYEAVGRLGPQALRPVYCSNTAAADMIHGRAVAARMGGVVSDTGDGTGFGYAVDYPTSTNSIVLGVLWTPDGAVSRSGSPALCISQGVAACGGFATITVNHLIEPRTTNAQGLGSTAGAEDDADWGLGRYGVCLETANGTGTLTATLFVSTRV